MYPVKDILIAEIAGRIGFWEGSRDDGRPDSYHYINEVALNLADKAYEKYNSENILINETADQIFEEWLEEIKGGN